MHSHTYHVQPERTPPDSTRAINKMRAPSSERNIGNNPIAHSFVNFDVTTATPKSTPMNKKELES